MNNMNSGYHGWSMSKRAYAAYEDGEMPKSKWTKAVMLAVIAEWLDDNDVELPPKATGYLDSLTKAELFGRFFCCTGWHHTSKFANVTNFYGVDECILEDFAENPTKRVYRVKVILGHSKKVLSDTFDTEAKAAKKLEGMGFRCFGRFYERKAFRAFIEVKRVPL